MPNSGGSRLERLVSAARAFAGKGLRPWRGGRNPRVAADAARPGQDAPAAVPGIAIVTYRRPLQLAKCLAQIRRRTEGTFELLVVSDETGNAETSRLCAQYGATLVEGANRGVAWNKNRGLFYFMSRTACDPILLLEDDTYPVSQSWLSQWVQATAQWHHVNFSHPGILAKTGSFRSGEGTPAKPYVHTLVTGQCTGVSRAAMAIGGYLDTRFKGYGHGHVEWTKRHNRLLSGKLIPKFPPGEMVFLSIKGGLKAKDAPTFRREADVARNEVLLRAADDAPAKYRDPWENEQEKAVLAAEVGAAREAH